MVDVTTEAGADNIYEMRSPIACFWCRVGGCLGNIFQKFVTERVFLELTVAHQVGGSG